MGKLKVLYPIAIEQTKQKINHHIDCYLEVKEKLPDFETYILDTQTYVEQIWLDLWVNKASNEISKKEKKQFLHDLGIETTGIEQKIVSKMFRSELEKYRPFNVLDWLKETYDKEAWNLRYVKAKENYSKKLQGQQEAENQWVVQSNIQKFTHEFFDEHALLLYIHVRYHIAQKLGSDFNYKPKFYYIEPYMLENQLETQGSFNSKDYVKLSDFFEEYTGGIHSLIDWGRSYYEYETYFYFYERIVYDFISELAPNLIIENLTVQLQDTFNKAYGVQIMADHLFELIGEELVDIADACFDELQEEYVDDLLQLSWIPFNQDVHISIFEKDVEERERRIEEELAEKERQKAEEIRIFNEIFGQAYAPTSGRSMKYVLHIGETNSGKTYQALQKMKETTSGWYLSPLRLLAFEVYEKLNTEGILCSLLTGEEEKRTNGAKHISSTVEMFHESEHYDVIVIDEAQMIADKDRGFSWYQAIMKANAKEVHIIGSRNIKPMLYDLLDGSHIELNEYYRETPLEVEQKEFNLKDTKKGDAIVCFSRKRVLETASMLQKTGFSVSVIYGSMPPENRKRQIERFNNGETSVVVSTDAIGMGLNLPIQRIVFIENEKFDGTRRRRLTSQEVKQIAGRAGRKGIYNVGKVAFTSDVKAMQKLLSQEDEPVENFAIAPTTSVFERFQNYYRDMGKFFEMWLQFEPPKGTQKSTLSQERELYRLICNTEIEARFSIKELYGFLHLPFSGKEQGLVKQWFETMKAIAEGKELPEPLITTKSLEDLELSYKAIGLHLLFLYRLNRSTEALYWERIKQDISNGVHDHLKGEIITHAKKCRRCEIKLQDNFRFPICDTCYRDRKKGEKKERR